MSFATPTERDPAHQRAAKAQRPRRVPTLIISAVGILLLLRAAIFVADAGLIGAGYAAKQLCSGVFVARLPERFVVDTDVLPRLATVGPFAQLLDYSLDRRAGKVSASLLGQRVVAEYQPETGCTLVQQQAREYGLPVPSRTSLSTLTDISAAQRPDATSADAAADEPNSTPPLPALTGALDGALNNAFAESITGNRNTLAVVVLHRGQRIAARYADSVTVSTPMQGWSMNKSLMATFIGYQVDSGKLSLESSVIDALEKQRSDAAIIGRVDTTLTLGHLLSMTSGFDFSERYFPGDDVTDMLYQQPAMWLSAPRTGHRDPPGTRFAYSSGDINLASLIWQQSLEEEPYTDWLSSNFSQPLGLAEMVLEPDASGIQVGSSYAYLTADDWARMGQLRLDAWHGRSDTISQAWQRQAVTPGTAINGEIYGLGFWLNTDRRAFPHAPPSAFYAGGNSGQFVVVLPEQELVVVRLGLTLDESQADVDSLLGDVLQAVATVAATQ